VVDEVGKGCGPLHDALFRKNDAVLDFDLAKVIEQFPREPGVSTCSTAHARGQLRVSVTAREVVPDLPEGGRRRGPAFLDRSGRWSGLTDPCGNWTCCGGWALYPRTIEAAAAAT